MAKQERAVRTRNALIESAAQLFDQEGFEVVTLAAISARAGVSNGALHFHFASKAALADAVGRAAAQRLERITGVGEGSGGGGAPHTAGSAGLPRGGGADSPGGGSLQVLVDASHALLHGLSHDVVLRAGFALTGGADSVTGGDHLHRHWHEYVIDILGRADRESVLAKDVSARDAASTIVAAVVGFETLGARDERWLSRNTLTRFWTLLLPRLAASAVLAGLDASGRSPAGNSGSPGAHGTPAPANDPTGRPYRGTPGNGPA
ncbi:TetR family transcriptional regulator [Streptomyces sp. NPDC086783]|uniref:TetR family transcriptional regulator n=1 Tax=Streptomyces sp. NPDC086783 TaxID=3365758 RepID=UPI00380F3675